MSMDRSETISRIGSYQVLGVDFTGDDANIGVPPWAFVSVRTLAQRVRIHFFHVGSFLGREQPARLFPLAS